MRKTRLMAPSPENDALAAAILWLKDEPLDSRLMEASFGRYADRSGCWWRLRFQRDVMSGQVEDSRQDDENRFSMVIGAWAAEFGSPAGQVRHGQQ
jgi:hypothetical protein